MKAITKTNFSQIKTWVCRNARPLEMALWKYHFENGSREDVLSALSQYQNADGGFGNALEPDNWNPESTPYTVNYAIHILRQIGFTEVGHPLYQGIFRFLMETKHRADHGWLFSVPANDQYPHAIWWQYNEKGNEVQGIGITAELCGFILRYADTSTPLYQLAQTYADALIQNLETLDQYGGMGVQGAIALLEDLSAAGLGSRYDLAFLEAKARSMVENIMKEVSWGNHVDMAVTLPSPKSRFYPHYEKAVEEALDELIHIRPDEGVWGIPWEWYDDSKYAKEFAISENWWKSNKAIEKLLFLREYDRIDLAL